MRTLTECRTLIHTQLETNTFGIVPYDQVPDDVAGLPAIVTGRPSAGPGSDSAGVTLDVTVDVWLIGRRDQDAELVALADHVLFDLFGGARGVTLQDDPRVLVYCDAADPRQVPIAGEVHQAYVLTVTGTIGR